MAVDRVTSAQRGVPLADITPVPSRGSRRARTPKTKTGRRVRAARRRSAASRGAAAVLTGPFLGPGSLTGDERRQLIAGIQTVLDGVYAHLPLKRARYGFDPVQRLSILATQAEELTDDEFHGELADLVTRLRDAHTRYAGPSALASKVAALPFLVEMIGTPANPTYIVTKVGAGLDPAFVPGVELEYWNGVPIDRAVQRHSDHEVGGRPDTQRAWAVQSLTLRSLQYGPPPDEHWVIIGYRTVPSRGGAGASMEIRIPWQVIDPSQIAPLLQGGPTGRRARALRLTLAVNPAAEAVRRAKMLLFAPQALLGRNAPAAADTAGPIATTLTQTLRAQTIEAPGGPYGYLRIWGFDAAPSPFITELIRLIPLLPDKGLIIDVRGNPGGYILAAELALQLFTPHPIEPTRFSALATPFTRAIAGVGDLAVELAPWRRSLDAAVRNGEPYAQPLPISDPELCNAIGQQYGGPVVLVGDSTTYSAGDLFSAGFVDNAIGPFICVGSATGAGGANVWNYGELRQALTGSPVALPALPDGIDLSFSFRRATRARASEGLQIEDVGVAGEPYAMTRDDLLLANRDLLARCVAVIRAQPFSRLAPTPDLANRTITVQTAGLDRVDATADGRPLSTQPVAAGASVGVSYPAGTRVVELTGFAGDDVRQRRRVPTR